MLTTVAFALWAGAVTAGAPLELGQALAGAFDIAPVALPALGAAALDCRGIGPTCARGERAERRIPAPAGW